MSDTTIALGDIAEINPETPIRAGRDDVFSFIPMNAIDENDACISVYANRPYSNLANGYVSFAERDVLLAKITPCMENGKCAIASGLRNGVGFGSTEFHIVRASDRVLPEWIYYFWRLPTTRALAERNMTGPAGQKRVPQSYLQDLPIYLPALRRQTEIVHSLKSADRVRRLRRHALEMCDELLIEGFLEIFGDPAVNPHGFPVVELGEFLSFVTSGSRGWAEYYVAEGTRFIRSLDVRMNSISDDDAVFVNPPKSAEANRTRVKAGDVLLTITGSQIGRVAPAPERLNGAFISQHVAILRLKPGLLPIFLSMFLSLETGGQREIARVQYGQSKPGLNLQQIREFRMPLPPLNLQKAIVEVIGRNQHLRATYVEAMRQADHLFHTRLHQAFSSQK
jgi:type I restriction enzyme, S subunit